MGLPEEGYVGRRLFDVLPMGPLDGSDVLGLREGQYQLEAGSFRLVPIGSACRHYPGRQ